jgi:aspartyl/asparaginyl beta-hydroxylase (cupin superfamily)
MQNLERAVTCESLRQWSKVRNIAQPSLTRIYEGIRQTELTAGVADQQGESRPRLFFPNLRTLPIWDTNQFSWVSDIESNTDTIRGEYLTAGSTEASVDGIENVRTRGGRWSIRYLACVGRLHGDARVYFERSIRCLSDVPGALTCGMAYFSTVAGGTHILPHCGFTNAHLRCHLTLSSAPNCSIRVGSQLKTWHEGRMLIFDDSYEHEVWNNSTADRTVLLFDIFHPDLTRVEQEALVFMASQWRRSAVKASLVNGFGHGSASDPSAQ